MPPGPTLEDIQTRIFDNNCLTSGCHNSADRAGNLLLVGGESYAELIRVQPDNPNALRAGRLRVDPGNVDNSFLVVKLEGPPRGQGSPMPLLGELSPEDIQLVRDWVLNGAPE